MMADCLADVLDRLFERRLVGDGDLAGAAHCHGLEILGAHHRAGAAATGRPLLVVHDAGKQDLLFSGLSDAGHLDLGVAQFFLDRFLSLIGVKPPQGAGVTDLDVAVIDPQVDRGVRLALDDETIEAR